MGDFCNGVTNFLKVQKLKSSPSEVLLTYLKLKLLFRNPADPSSYLPGLNCLLWSYFKWVRVSRMPLPELGMGLSVTLRL